MGLVRMVQVASRNNKHTTYDPIKGFSVKEADPITGDSVRHVATWNGDADVSSLKGKPIVLRFHLDRCKLYSFIFERGGI